MKNLALTRAIGLATLGAGLCAPLLAYADFLEDSKASLQMRNFYMGRDYRQSDDGKHPAPPGAGKMNEWAQGFILRYESGFTEGPVGFGADAIGALGIKLNSGPGTSGTGILQRDRETNRAQDYYGDLHATAKIRYSKTTLRAGSQPQRMALAQPNDSRLLPTVFQGTVLNIQEIDRLSLDVGRYNRVNLRDSSDYERLSMTTGNRRNISVRSGADTTSDDFRFLNASYKWTPELTTTLAHGELQDLYRQTMVNVMHVLPLSEGRSFTSDLRYARSAGETNSNVDNDAFGALFTYAVNFHSLGLGYQSMSGKTGFAYLSGTDPFLVNFVQISDFGNRDEKSWQARYDYNFEGIGIPGLSFMTRYLSGDNIDLGAARSEGREWERDIELMYSVQSGTFKGVNLRWRNATTRSNFAHEMDENRVIVSYTLPLW